MAPSDARMIDIRRRKVPLKIAYGSSSIGRAAVSKTAGSGFNSSLPCLVDFGWSEVARKAAAIGIEMENPLILLR